MPDQPDLTAELDDAEKVISGEVEKVVTEWGYGVTRADGREVVMRARSEAAARRHVERFGYRLVKHQVTYGAWQDA